VAEGDQVKFRLLRTKLLVDSGGFERGGWATDKETEAAIGEIYKRGGRGAASEIKVSPLQPP
jgi:hypothetical protein